jgi:hypothetical protein
MYKYGFHKQIFSKLFFYSIDVLWTKGVMITAVFIGYCKNKLGV